MCSASLMHNNSKGRIIGGLHLLGCQVIDLKMFSKNASLYGFKYVFKATSKQKCNIIHSLNRLRTINIWGVDKTWTLPSGPPFWTPFWTLFGPPSGPLSGSLFFKEKRIIKYIKKCKQTNNKVPYHHSILHILPWSSKGDRIKCFHRVVTKISSCWVNTSSRRGIERLGISFGSVFLLFSNKSSRGPLS